MGFKQIADLLETAPGLHPVLVLPLRSMAEIEGLQVDDWHQANKGARQLTSLSGIIKYCEDEEEGKTFVIQTSRREGEKMVLGDIEEGCNANNRMGCQIKEVAGYVGTAFTDGTFRTVLVTDKTTTIASLPSHLEDRATVFFNLDMLENMDTPLGKVIMDISKENGYDAHRILEEPVWGRGSLCGAISFRADMAVDRIGRGWTKKEREEMPPFMSDADVDMASKPADEALSYFRNRKIMCGPACMGAVTNGLKKGEEQIVEPYPEITLVINASVQGAIELLHFVAERLS
ncbi:MAG: hypothetical protein QCI38_06365 [Candidatus Thermoplasmatota archaeon]|nr:hypothetical protein [Candidatus Thermoplasmatota archaeon]